jgi:hypothetical protein
MIPMGRFVCWLCDLRRPRYAYGRIGWWRDEDELGRTRWRWYARWRGRDFGLREGYWKALDD